MASPTAQDEPQSSYEEILAGIGDLTSFTPYGNLILIGIYMRGTVKTLPDGKKFYFTDKTADEDRFQGKTGYVLRKGSLAFADDSNIKFGGQNVEIGQYVMFRVSDGFPVDINGVHCRLIEDVHIKASLDGPASTIVW